jgi:hypothetical protein
LYDKVSRDDILAHAYAQCRSNKGAPGIDGQDFADIEAYGVERWLAELALALRQETYRPEPIRSATVPLPRATAGRGAVHWGAHPHAGDCFIATIPLKNLKNYDKIPHNCPVWVTDG